MPYIVANNRPYYPSVQQVDTLEEAIRIRDELLRHEKDNDGTYENEVFIAEIVDVKTFRSFY